MRAWCCTQLALVIQSAPYERESLLIYDLAINASRAVCCRYTARRIIRTDSLVSLAIYCIKNSTCGKVITGFFAIAKPSDCCSFPHPFRTALLRLSIPCTCSKLSGCGWGSYWCNIHWGSDNSRIFACSRCGQICFGLN